MKTGVIFGKFYPLHTGHQNLIDTALSQVDLLTIVVTGKKGQIIKPQIRGGWLKKIYPQVKIKVIVHNIADDDDETWAKKTPIWLGYKPDIIFTSAEKWGDHFAKLTKAKHVAVDKGRKKNPISATMIRKNPKKYLKYLHPIVSKFFEKKGYGKIDEKIL